MKKWLLVSLFLVIAVSVFATGGDGKLYIAPSTGVPGATIYGITITARDFTDAWGSSGNVAIQIPTQLPVPQLTPDEAGAVTATVKGAGGIAREDIAIEGRRVTITVHDITYASKLEFYYYIVALPTSVTGSLTFSGASKSDHYSTSTAMSSAAILVMRTATTAPTNTPTPTATPSPTPTQITIANIREISDDYNNLIGMYRYVGVYDADIDTAVPKYFTVITGAKPFYASIGIALSGAAAIAWQEAGTIGAAGTTVTAVNKNRLAGLPTPGIKAYEDSNTLAVGTTMNAIYFPYTTPVEKTSKYVLKPNTLYWFSITADADNTKGEFWLEGFEK